MRKFVGEEKPDLEELAHHGVKGMHWGVRKAHPTSAEIHGARQRQHAREDQLHEADRQAANAHTAKERTAAVKRAQKVARDWQTNEDRVTAARLTAGEKFMHVLLLGPLATVTLASASAGAKRQARATDAARAQLAAEKK